MPTPPHKVLIVEDEGVVALDLQQALNLLGYDAFAVASTGDEALRRAAETCPDVVLMDIRIEGARDGVETATLLRQRFDVPVVFLTAHADGATVDRAKRAEPYGYLLKPVRESELRSAIEVAVYKHAMERRLRERERLSSLGTMAAGVAHEVNNPLSVIAGNITFVSDQLSERRARLGEGEADERAHLDALLAAQADAVEAVRRISRVVGDLRTFSRPQPARGRATVAEAIAFAVRITSNQFQGRARVTVEDEAPDAQVALADVRLEQVLINLLLNAVHAMPAGRPGEGAVTVRARRDAARVVIEVADDGEGIPPAVISRVFEPFFTTKEAGSGSGLGLAICHGIVTAAGGTIAAESEEGRGSLFRVSLSSAAEPAAPPAVAPAEAATSVPPRRGARIMVVDDEPMILDVMRRILVGHEVVCFADAGAALAALESGPDFAIIFSDLAMPAMSGVEFYEAVLARSPEVARRIVFLTGGATSPRGEAFLAVVPNARLYKPIYPDVLTRLVHDRLAEPGAPGG